MLGAEKEVFFSEIAMLCGKDFLATSTSKQEECDVLVLVKLLQVVLIQSL